MLCRLYLRASTDEQDATRARASLEAFAAERGLTIAAAYVENESGAKLARPELFRLLADSRPGDILLIEQVDRLSRLTEADWTRLRANLAARQVRVVALDLPTSWTLATSTDEFTSRMHAAINGMMLDVLAAVARKDYEDRRRRQAQGQAKAKAEGRYKGRPADVKRNDGIACMLAKGVSWSKIQAATGCSRATVAKIAKRAGRNAAEAINV
jgi:DNA invertase Pin-like site-specific DNA recombinase